MLIWRHSLFAKAEIFALKLQIAFVRFVLDFSHKTCEIWMESGKTSDQILVKLSEFIRSVTSKFG